MRLYYLLTLLGGLIWSLYQISPLFALVTCIVFLVKLPRAVGRFAAKHGSGDKQS